MYRCSVCKEFSELRQPCMTQHFKDGEEKRCLECYEPKTEKQFNLKKSFAALECNLVILQEKLSNTDEISDEYSRIKDKIRETIRRISNVKETTKAT